MRVLGIFFLFVAEARCQLIDEHSILTPLSNLPKSDAIKEQFTTEVIVAIGIATYPGLPREQRIKLINRLDNGLWQTAEMLKDNLINKGSRNERAFAHLMLRTCQYGRLSDAACPGRFMDFLDNATEKERFIFWHKIAGLLI